MQTHDSVHSMLIQQFFNLFHNFLPSFFFGGGQSYYNFPNKSKFSGIFLHDCFPRTTVAATASHRPAGPIFAKKRCPKPAKNRRKIIIRILSPPPNDRLPDKKNEHGAEKIAPCPFFRNLPPRMRLPESDRHFQRVQQVSAPAIRPAASMCSIRFFHRLYSPKTDTPSR